MTRFEECLFFTLKFEGGYVNNVNDHGGATNKGITQNVYDSFRRKCGLPVQPVQFIFGNEVKDIYLENYFSAAHCHQLEQPIDFVVFDAAVHSGVSQSIRFLQATIGVDTDGVFGPHSAASLASCIKYAGAKEVAANALAKRRKFLQTLVEHNNSQAGFLAGWMSRCDQIAVILEGKK